MTFFPTKAKLIEERLGNKMEVSLDFLLRLSSDGDELATLAIDAMIDYIANGLNPKAIFNFSGKQITILLG